MKWKEDFDTQVVNFNACCVTHAFDLGVGIFSFFIFYVFETTKPLRRGSPSAESL